jgi:hypothetical protein
MNSFAEAGMNVIKINKRIESNDIHIEGLEKYIGKDAEIIVLIDSEQVSSWPDNFFDETYGSIPDFPERGPQGDFEKRESL